MQTLIPQPATATAKPIGRIGRWWRFGLTPLAMLLFASGLLLAAPAFWRPRAIWFMVAWDAGLLLLWLVDAALLPRPEAFDITRSFLDSPQLGQPTRVELSVVMQADAVIDLRLTDDLHPSLVAKPEAQRVQVFPRDPAIAVQTIRPAERGDFALGRVYLRYRGMFRLAERWCAALPVVTQEAWAGAEAGLSTPLRSGRDDEDEGGRSGRDDKDEGGRSDRDDKDVRGRSGRDDKDWDGRSGGDDKHSLGAQRVRVFPALEENRGDAEFYLLRARQIEMQKRRLRLRGTGRDFESLRDYQQGDELRNVSWTATARRDKLVARQFTVERSQQVWIVIDAGRLSRTGFELRRGVAEVYAETEAEREQAHLLTVTQLDQATEAASMLAQVINGSGDKFALLAYGRSVQQLLPPGAGPAHLRVLIDLLSQTRSERAEADHLGAIARLKNLQRRRGLIVWVTELVDSAGRPEVITAAAELVRRHLVVLVLLKHPELDSLAASKPAGKQEMFHIAAAQEMLERRREAIAQLERQGVLIVETTAEQVGVNTISKYLEVKAQGMI